MKRLNVKSNKKIRSDSKDIADSQPDLIVGSLPTKLFPVVKSKDKDDIHIDLRRNSRGLFYFEKDAEIKKTSKDKLKSSAPSSVIDLDDSSDEEQMSNEKNKKDKNSQDVNQVKSSVSSLSGKTQNIDESSQDQENDGHKIKKRKR